MTIEAFGQDTADGLGTAVISDATTNVKGAWVEIASATSNDNEWITVTFQAEDANDLDFLVDIGAGAAASESAIISNIPVTTNGLGGGMFSITLPLTIASGTRLSARVQCATGSRAIGVSLHLSDEDSFGTAASCITLGADTTNTKGTVIDPGGSANTKGSWTQLSASTSADIDYFAVLIGLNNNLALGNPISGLIDIATGAAASESVLVGNISYEMNIQEYLINPVVVFFQNIPSGTRVSARCQSSETDATDRLIDVAIIGCNMTAPSGGGGGMKLAGRGGLAG